MQVMGAALVYAEMSGPQQTSMSRFFAGCSSKRNSDEQEEDATKKKKANRASLASMTSPV